MSDDEQRRAELGERIATRRKQLGIHEQTEAASAAGISAQTWRAAEYGRPVSARTYQQIDRALRWHPRSCVLYLETGAEPVPEDDAPELPSPAPEDVPQVDPLIVEIVTDEVLTADQKGALLEMIARQRAEVAARREQFRRAAM